MEQSVKDILADDFWIMPATPEYIDKGVPYITSKNIKNGTIDFSKVNYISQEDYEYISKNRPILVGDILISMIGTLGETAEVKETDGLFYGQNMFLVRIDESKVNKRYFLNFFKSNCVKRALKGKQNQSTQKYLKANHIEDLIIPVPDVTKQELIAKQLDKLTYIITLRTNELKQLDDLIKARFVEMFGDCTNMISLSDLCLIITDGTHQSPKFQHEGIPFILVSNLSKNTVTYDTDKFISAETYKELYKRTPIEIGDILLSTVGSYGHPAVVVEDRKFLFQRHIAYLKPKSDILNSYYMHGALLSPGCQRQIEEKVKGIAQKTLNLSEIRKIRIPVPSLDLQKQYADFVHQVNKSKVAVQKALDETQMLFDSLMQEYFN